VHYDDGVAGFGVRVTAAATKSFILNYRVRGSGRERRYTIGAFPDWTTVAARAKARELRRLISDGGDPLGDLKDERAAPTMADLIERFEQEHLPRKRPGTVVNYRVLLGRHVRPHFGERKVADVRFEDVDSLHGKITKQGFPYAANRCKAVLSKMFNLAIRWNMRPDNPCRGIEKNHEAKRKRYLSGDELARLIKALAVHPDKRAANIIRLLMLTGARRGEVLAMRWADIDVGNGTWTKPASTTKQKADHVVPLSAPARQLLAEIQAQAGKRPLGEYVFPSGSDSGHVVDIKRAWRTLCEGAGITGLRIHDLRHSFASQLASGGASLPLIGALLGHSNPTTTARYTHLFDDPQRAAVERIGAVIGAAGKHTEEPVALPKGGRHGRR
jgi:integrase